MSTTSSLAYKDLRGYIDAVEGIGELRVVNGADWDLEVGAITEVAARALNPKVLLFDDVKGYPNGFRVLTNPVCSAATTALAFGLEPKLTGLEIIRAWKEKLGSQKPLKPVAVSNGPITENLDSGNQVDLLKFPTPRWHEADGGRYIGTGCMVIMQDPEENWKFRAGDLEDRKRTGPTSVPIAYVFTTTIPSVSGFRRASTDVSSGKNIGPRGGLVRS